MTVQYAVLGPADAHHTAWILHGILGSGRNWRSFVRRLIAAHPGWRFVLPDLRNHGATGPLPGASDLASCAQDLRDLPHADVVIGHSFGGKVALAWASEHRADQVWILDSIPVDTDGLEDSQVTMVLDALAAVSVPAAERRDVRASLLAAQVPTMLVDWLLTSLREGPDGWDWVYDIDGVSAMLESYFTTDFGALLATNAGDMQIHLVRAANSERWTDDVLGRLELGPSTHLHVLENAGHWLHVDNPKGTLALLGPAFTRS